eukprot:gene1930-47125_t
MRVLDEVEVDDDDDAACVNASQRDRLRRLHTVTVDVRAEVRRGVQRGGDPAMACGDARVVETMVEEMRVGPDGCAYARGQF